MNDREREMEREREMVRGRDRDRDVRDGIIGRDRDRYEISTGGRRRDGELVLFVVSSECLSDFCLLTFPLLLFSFFINHCS